MGRNTSARDTQIRKPSPDPKSTSAMKLLKSWLQACDHHEECGISDTQTRSIDVPARLIYVGTSETAVLQLINVGNHCPPYLALSYCWGPSGQTILTSTTLHGYLSGIAEETLSRSASDAIFLARQLDITCVWIDAMCIVQDDPNDWETEAAKMGGIYRGARLVVCAANSPTASTGFLHERLPLVVDCGRASRSFLDSDRLYITLAAEYLSLLVGNEPLSRRAWCLQERMLSRRMVYFTRHEMIWKCFKSTLRECGREAHLIEENTCDENTYPWKARNRDNSDKELGLSFAHQAWEMVIERYSACALTYPHDKLVALSAVAKQFHANFLAAFPHIRQLYLAGTWLTSLPESLLWHPKWTDSRTSYPVLNGPSWSWSSVHCRINHTGETDSTLMAMVDDFHVKPAGPNAYGDVSECWLRITAPILTTSFAAARGVSISASGRGAVEDICAQFTSITFQPEIHREDALFFVDPHCPARSGELELLIIARRHWIDAPALTGILVAPSGEDSKTYKRVGHVDDLLNINDDDLARFTRTIKLV